MDGGGKLRTIFWKKMVKTRHSGDLDESGDNVFMTLPPRAARVKKMYEPQMNVSLQNRCFYPWVPLISPISFDLKSWSTISQKLCDSFMEEKCRSTNVSFSNRGTDFSGSRSASQAGNGNLHGVQPPTFWDFSYFFLLFHKIPTFWLLKAKFLLIFCNFLEILQLFFDFVSKICNFLVNFLKILENLLNFEDFRKFLFNFEKMSLF